ncbi:MAG TPA: coproporphyrinogen III oxidase, partial [Bacteroidales bacterium]|nr:coproporphyrinogen III oxidase [Bacteroidales bacterium]
MAGIYIHIPFCRRKCGYCNFFSLATTRSREAFTSALVAELHFRAREAASEAVGTVYWGGGTPSLLEPIQFRRIMEAIHASYALEPDA